MKPSSNCNKLIEHFESLSLVAYLCPAGILTIGYGHTGKDVKPNMVITDLQAEALLDMDMTTATNAVNNYINGQLTQGQFDALVSFVFNIGVEAFRSSTLRKLVNGCRYDAAALEFKKWNQSKGKVLDGLVKRRAAESWLFRTGMLRLM